MRKTLKTALLLSSLAIVNLASAQGNGNGNLAQLEVNCRPTIIVGEHK